MNRGPWLGISLGLNVALVALILWAVRWREPRLPAPAAAGILTNRVVRVRHAEATNTMVVAVNAPFHWAQVESPDYRVYVANLRSIDCPETILRDIIEADLNAMYAGRVRDLVDAVTGRFWELMLKPAELEQLVTEKERELRSLGEEKEEILHILFEENAAAVAAREREERAQALANRKEQLDFLPDEKIAAVQEAYDRQNAGVNANERAEPRLTPAEKQQRLKELEAERERSIQALLTPEEFEEYRLRVAGAADVRFGFGDMDINEAEARAIAAAKLGPQSEDRIGELLGPERYAEYRRNGDGDFQQARRITDRFELPAATAVRIYEIQKAAQAQAKPIRTDTQRSVEERQATLRALQAETENSIAAVLGPEVFRTYQRYNGIWLSRFAEGVK